MNNHSVSVWRNAWSPMNDLRQELDALIGDFGLQTAPWATDQAYLSPPCDVFEEEGHYLLSLEIPGVAKDDIKIETVDNQLSISGERRADTKSAGRTSLYTERRYGKFRKVFTLASGLEASKIEASYQDGVLRVLVPKPEAAKPRQIKINAGVGTSLLGKFFGHSGDSKEAPESQSEAREAKIVS